jgi:hypothetical protein
MSHAVGRTILLRGCEPQAITKDAEAQAEE